MPCGSVALSERDSVSKLQYPQLYLDADAITAAFQDYARAIVKKASRPSVRERLAQFRDMIKEAVKDKEKHREPVR